MMLQLLLAAAAFLCVTAEPGNGNLRGSDDRNLAKTAGVGPGGGIWFGPASSTNKQTLKCNSSGAYITEIKLCADDKIRGIYSITCNTGVPNSSAVIGTCDEASAQTISSSDGFKGAVAHSSVVAFGGPFSSCVVFSKRTSPASFSAIYGSECALGMLDSTFGKNTLAFKRPTYNQVITQPASQASNEGFAWCYSNNNDATARINKLYVKKAPTEEYPWVSGLGIGCA